MNEKIVLNFDSTNLKKPYHVKNNGFSSMLREILKLNLQHLNGSIQEYSPLYLKMRVALLHRNLERTKSMKFGTEINVYGWKY